ncbi:MAG: sugar ABC transporter permease [Anaerolineae bacterium]|nr:sugar ABC transporter permease [Anaerolineae bacterium]
MRLHLARPGLLRWTSQEKKDFAKGLVFISPWLIGLVAFTIYPAFSSLYYGFTYYDIVRAPRWVGFGNYQQILRDKEIPRVLYNSLYMAFIGVPAVLITSFLSGVFLNQKMRFRSVLRTGAFVPSVVPVVASAMVWLWLLNTQYGLINSFLKSRSLPVIPFLSSPVWAKPSLILINCWASGGAMVIFLAALRDVPQSLYDAAKVDGASALTCFWHVTIPMVTPAILYNLLIGLIEVFQSFTFAWILTGGGPYSSTEFYAVYLYRNAFQFMKMGYASAMAWILFVVVMGVTFAVFRSSARWVYYRGSNE